MPDRAADLRELSRKIAAALKPAAVQRTSGRKHRRVFEAPGKRQPPAAGLRPGRGPRCEIPPGGVAFVDLRHDQCRAFMPGEAGQYGRCCGQPVEGGKGLAASSYCAGHRAAFVLSAEGRPRKVGVAWEWVNRGRGNWRRVEPVR